MLNINVDPNPYVGPVLSDTGVGTFENQFESVGRNVQSKEIMNAAGLAEFALNRSHSCSGIVAQSFYSDCDQVRYVILNFIFTIILN